MYVIIRDRDGLYVLGAGWGCTLQPSVGTGAVGIKGSRRQQPEAPTHRPSTLRGLDRAHPKGMVFGTSPYPNYIYYPTS